MNSSCSVDSGLVVHARHHAFAKGLRSADPFLPACYLSEVGRTVDEPFVILAIQRVEEPLEPQRATSFWKLLHDLPRLPGFGRRQRESDRFVATEVVANTTPVGEFAKCRVVPSH